MGKWDLGLIDRALLSILRCPESGQSLQIEGDGLVTADRTRKYAIIEGIPVLLLESEEPTHQGYLSIVEQNKRRAISCRDYKEEDVAKFLDGMLVATCGNLFHGVHLLEDYPIPDFPSFSKGATVLDVGCNWGRWSIAGAKNGYRIVGIDIHLDSLLCARHLAKKLALENEPFFVLADARHLPFAAESFDGAFSYSVIQHFSKHHAAAILGEISRVMKYGAKSVIQMPNRAGLGTILSKGRTRNYEGTGFDVRYYSIGELLEMFESKIGTSDWYVDCFLGLNVHARDRRFVPISKRWIVDIADQLHRASQIVPAFGRLADSVFVSSTKTRKK